MDSDRLRSYTAACLLALGVVAGCGKAKEPPVKVEQNMVEPAEVNLGTSEPAPTEPKPGPPPDAPK